MPAITITLSRKLEPNEKAKLAVEAAAAVADGMKKPEGIVMSMILDGVAMNYQNDCDAASAFAAIGCIGLIPTENRRNTVRLLCGLLKKYEVDPARTLVKFEESEKSDWGTNDLLVE